MWSKCTFARQRDGEKTVWRQPNRRLQSNDNERFKKELRVCQQCQSSIQTHDSSQQFEATEYFQAVLSVFFSSYTHYTYYALYAHFHLGIVCSNRRINFIWKVNNKQKKRKKTITISSMCKRQEFLDTTLSFTNEIKRKKTFSQLVSHVNASRPVDTIFSSSFSLWLCSSLSCSSH